ncbi:MAG: hypothetical protein ACR2G7_06145 [Acidimicrobiales bacterium]
MSIEGIALVLRNLRSRLDLDQAVTACQTGSTGPSRGAGCVADLDAYDQALVSAAAMVDVPLPPPPEGERRFSAEQRAQVEADLVAAGVDLQGGDQEPGGIESTMDLPSTSLQAPFSAGEPTRTSAGGAAEDLRRLLGAPEPADCPADTPPGPSLAQPGVGRSNGRALWRCEHCGWEGTAWVRPECPRCYTMSTQALRWV